MEDTTGSAAGGTLARIVLAACLAAASLPSAAAGYRYGVVHEFDSAEGGRIPMFGEPVEGPDGHLYGTTYASNHAEGFGTVYRLSKSGSDMTVLHEFVADGTDGTHPYGGLSLGSDGSLYGATFDGGSGSGGVIFRISPAGDYAVLHSFSGPEGLNPIGPPIQASDGNFYGATFGGGDAGCGVIYRLSAAGELTPLHSLDPAQACSPWARLTQGSDGQLYGTARGGGATGQGSVFRISLAGKWKTLHSFDAEGYDSFAALVQAGNGRFYGTTSSGGSSGLGTVFSVSPSGAFKTLHTFAGGSADGGGPMAGLVQTPDGYLRGTTAYGGAYGAGTAYRISLSGKVRIEHHFGELAEDGAGQPNAGFTLASDGNLYGTARVGGSHYVGSVFRMKPKAP